MSTTQQQTDQNRQDATSGATLPSDSLTAPTATPSTPDAEQAPVDAATAPAVDSADAPDAGKTGNAEAARYRVQLRESEAKVAELTTQLEAMRKTEVGRILAEHAKPGNGPAWAHGVNEKALFASGVSLADLTDDTGAIDVTRLQAAVENARAMFGIPALPTAPPADGDGSSVHAGGPGAKSWGDVLSSAAGDRTPGSIR